MEDNNEENEGSKQKNPTKNPTRHTVNKLHTNNSTSLFTSNEI